MLVLLGKDSKDKTSCLKTHESSLRAQAWIASSSTVSITFIDFPIEDQDRSQSTDLNKAEVLFTCTTPKY